MMLPTMPFHRLGYPYTATATANVSQPSPISDATPTSILMHPNDHKHWTNHIPIFVLFPLLFLLPCFSHCAFTIQCLSLSICLSVTLPAASQTCILSLSSISPLFPSLPVCARHRILSCKVQLPHLLSRLTNC